jgi:hypothetical protein
VLCSSTMGTDEAVNPVVTEHIMGLRWPVVVDWFTLTRPVIAIDSKVRCWVVRHEGRKVREIWDGSTDITRGVSKKNV